MTSQLVFKETYEPFFNSADSLSENTRTSVLTDKDTSDVLDDKKNTLSGYCEARLKTIFDGHSLMTDTVDSRKTSPLRHWTNIGQKINAIKALLAEIITDSRLVIQNQKVEINEKKENVQNSITEINEKLKDLDSLLGELSKIKTDVFGTSKSSFKSTTFEAFDEVPDQYTGQPNLDSI